MPGNTNTREPRLFLKSCLFANIFDASYCIRIMKLRTVALAHIESLREHKFPLRDRGIGLIRFTRDVHTRQRHKGVIYQAVPTNSPVERTCTHTLPFILRMHVSTRARTHIYSGSVAYSRRTFRNITRFLLHESRRRYGEDRSIERRKRDPDSCFLTIPLKLKF